MYVYAILRSMPTKLGGVYAIVSALLLVLWMPFLTQNTLSRKSLYPLIKIIYFLFLISFFCLTFLGSMPVERPYLEVRFFLTGIYMLFPFIHHFLEVCRDYLLGFYDTFWIRLISYIFIVLRKILWVFCMSGFSSWTSFLDWLSSLFPFNLFWFVRNDDRYVC